MFFQQHEEGDLEVRFDDETKVVTCNCDELIHYSGYLPVTHHALVSIEVKKNIEMKHVTQSIAELMIFGRLSHFPVLQVCLTASSTASF